MSLEEDNMRMRRLIALIALTSATTLWSPGVATAAVEENFSFPVAGIVFEDICGETLTHTAGQLHVLISYTENDNRREQRSSMSPGARIRVPESGWSASTSHEMRTAQ
jgi:hypothetical protein